MKLVIKKDTLHLFEEGMEVFIPRPLPEELLLPIVEKALHVYLPPSTYARLSRRVRKAMEGKYTLASRRGRYSEVSPDTVMTIVSLRKAGLSVREISKRTGVPKSTVHDILKGITRLRYGEGEFVL